MRIGRRDFVLGLLCAPALGQHKESDKLAPYYPTPEAIVEQMLKLGELKAGEKTYDLGSGDGRIVIMAAERFKADAVGIEIDEDLVHRSRQAIKRKGLEGRARVVHGDVLAQDYSSADMITVYLLPGANDKLRPLLEKQLKAGTRLVAHDFQFSTWKPERTVDIEDDGEGRSHTLYLYRVK